MKNVNNRILFLDYMRIIAFSSVIVGHEFSLHFKQLWLDHSENMLMQNTYGILYKITMGGVLGVLLFFLVSGYIITHVLQSEKILEFYIQRIFRIYPLYIFSILIELFLSHLNGNAMIPWDILLQRIFLIGDFFGTPLSLGGVEWTLRIEIVFYFFMGIYKKIGLIEKVDITSCIFFFVTCMLAIFPAFPNSPDFHHGYFSIYVPFLFIGVIIYNIEKKNANLFLSIFCISMMFFLHLYMSKIYSPVWSEYHYTLYVLVLFLVSWKFRKHFISSWICLLFSDLTYSIYLFHKWSWNYISNLIMHSSLTYINTNILVLTFLFIICMVANRLIEKNGIRIGKIVKTRLFPLKEK